MAKSRYSRLFWARLALVCLSLAPVLLFAYIGQFMRLMRDDYSRIADARELDLLSFVMNYRNSWSGSFGNVFFQGVLRPLDGTIAQYMPAVIIAVWLLGLIWLLAIALRWLELDSSRLALATALASLLLAATINGFYSLESLYWYTASTAYALPIALAVLGIALTLSLIHRSRTRLQRVMTAALVALISFAVASFAEMILVFQLTALPFLGLVAALLADRRQRRQILLLIAIGWLATIVNGLVQVTAPGIGDRVDWYVGGGVTTPIRSLSELIPVTIALTFQYVTDQFAFAGFALVFAAGLVASLTLDDSARPSSAPRPLLLPASPLWLGLLVQVCFVPILWAHASDNPSVLGRYSFAYFVVVCLNAAAILAFLLLLMLRAKISAEGRRNKGFAATIMVVCWIAALAFFALTQIRSIHYRAAGHLFMSAISVLALLSCMLASARSAGDARRGALIALGFAAAIASAFVLLGLANFSIGYVRDRVMAPVTFLLVSTGLVWGGCLGSWLRQFLEANRLAARSLVRCKLAGALVVVTIGLGIFLGRLQWLPDLALYAREWDARHAYLLEMSEKGAADVEVAPLAYDMSQFFWQADISMKPENAAAERYYGIGSIVQTET